MYFDDKDDILNDIPDIQSDDAISLDSLLEVDDDGIVSLKNENPQSTQVQKEVFVNDSDLPSLDSIDFSNVSDSSQEAVDDVDEEELRRILNTGNTSSSTEESAEYTASDEYTSDSFENDISSDQDDITPKKDEIKKSSGVSPLLIALIFGLIVAGACYYGFDYYSNMESSKGNEELFNPQAEVPPAAEASLGESVEPVDQQPQIPVVNEEDASTLKPDEETEAPEKKVVVNVVPTGRANPFVPLKKYTTESLPTNTVVKTINNIDYDSVNIPLPPKEYGQISDLASKLMSVSVSGIMYDKNKPSAIITYQNDDYFVQVGDKLNQFKVIEIGTNYVKIALGKNIYKANIGEVFAKTDFYGNIPFENGSRQYYSSEEEFKSKSMSPTEYTSNQDVKIYAK